MIAKKYKVRVLPKIPYAKHQLILSAGTQGLLNQARELGVIVTGSSVEFTSVQDKQDLLIPAKNIQEVNHWLKREFPSGYTLESFEEIS